LDSIRENTRNQRYKGKVRRYSFGTATAGTLAQAYKQTTLLGEIA
jgi:hypothetical protein